MKTIAIIGGAGPLGKDIQSGTLPVGSELYQFAFKIRLKTAVQPRMDTDGHGYHAVAKTRRFTKGIRSAIFETIFSSTFLKCH